MRIVTRSPVIRLGRHTCRNNNNTLLWWRVHTYIILLLLLESRTYYYLVRVNLGRQIATILLLLFRVIHDEHHHRHLGIDVCSRNNNIVTTTVLKNKCSYTVIRGFLMFFNNKIDRTPLRSLLVFCFASRDTAMDHCQRFITHSPQWHGLWSDISRVNRVTHYFGQGTRIYIRSIFTYGLRKTTYLRV